MKRVDSFDHYNDPKYFRLFAQPAACGISCLCGLKNSIAQIHIRSRWRNWENPIEVAVSIGNHPAWAIGALAIGPYEEVELEVIGGLKESLLEMVQCKSVDLKVPAGAEIVLEGVVQSFVREEEGPFSEFTGYALGKPMAP